MRERHDTLLAVLDGGVAAGRLLLPQFRCSACGYGASCRIAPDRCPMCGGHAWEHKAPRSQEEAAADRDAPLTRERQS